MNNQDQEKPESFDPMDEAGSIGDEQLPCGTQGKTDKQEWNYAADKVKKESKVPEWLQSLLNAL